MFFHAPHNIYGPQLLRMFIDELGGVKHVHKYLGVTERSVLRWLDTGRVPRAAVLALFWESKWGRSHIFTDQVNEIRMLYQQLCLVREQYQKAKDIITGLRAMHVGSANEPVFDELPNLSFALNVAFNLGDGLPMPLPPAPSNPDTTTAPVSSRAAKAMHALDRTRAAARR
ncbi:hypothetical protein C8C95_2996 [Acidovorax sp. 99]|uniref:hypothetical protein n=1 Tax=Acidovorax sp. 99 TaxID=2135634 RepID=UPI000D5D8FBF|nr:hypothetical protein [Acidovorax sp. 99]PVY92131.1 hypothetical protein C8C95_2996 [Acidovorax sp. 99]